MQKVKQLALVFMQAFNLHVKQGIHVNGNFIIALHERSEALLIGAFRIGKCLAEICVLGQGGQVVQLLQVFDPGATDVH